MLLIELSPIMAFVEVRTLSYDDKAKIRAQHMRDHIVIVGCGHLGKRVTEVLTDLDLPFVLIVLPEDRERNEYVCHLMEKEIPVIFGDATLTSVLRTANVEKAKAIIISINNDYLNPVIADRARKLNPKAKIIVRIYNTAKSQYCIQSVGWRPSRAGEFFSRFCFKKFCDKNNIICAPPRPPPQTVVYLYR